jgi:hypothetical protein
MHPLSLDLVFLYQSPTSIHGAMRRAVGSECLRSCECVCGKSVFSERTDSPMTYVFSSIASTCPLPPMQPVVFASAALSCSLPALLWGKLLVQAVGLRVVVAMVPWVFPCVSSLLHPINSMHPHLRSGWVNRFSEVIPLISRQCLSTFQRLWGELGYFDKAPTARLHLHS